MLIQVFIVATAAMGSLGESNSSSSLRIGGGENAGIKYFPTTAVVVAYVSFFWNYKCGGTIIDARWVISAAHCLHYSDGTKIDKSDIQVGVGKEYVFLVAFTILSSSYKKVTDYYIHSNYVWNQGYLSKYDMVMLRLDEKLVFSDEIKAAKLHVNNDASLDDLELEICGFGSQYEGGWYTNQLQYALMVVVDENECTRIIGYDNYNYMTSICLKSREGNAFPCDGDSGDGLTINENGVRTLVAVFSGGPCHGVNPTVAARVSSSRDWIRTIIKEYS